MSAISFAASEIAAIQPSPAVTPLSAPPNLLSGIPPAQFLPDTQFPIAPLMLESPTENPLGRNQKQTRAPQNLTMKDYRSPDRAPLKEEEYFYPTKEFKTQANLVDSSSSRNSPKKFPKML